MEDDVGDERKASSEELSESLLEEGAGNGTRGPRSKAAGSAHRLGFLLSSGRLGAGRLSSHVRGVDSLLVRSLALGLRGSSVRGSTRPMTVCSETRVILIRPCSRVVAWSRETIASGVMVVAGDCSGFAA